METNTRDWAAFWSGKAAEETDFQATGRRRMDVVGFLYTVRECANLLQLSPSDRLLDIGCGTGIVALAISPYVRSIHAVDVSPGMVERARRNLSDAGNVRIDCGSILKIPADDASAEKVLAYSVLQYLPDVEAVRTAFREIVRVLAPGGRALFAANPDPAKLDAYLDFFVGPDHTARAREIALQKELLWLDQTDICALAEEEGLVASTCSLHDRIQQTFYMYDLLGVRR